MPPDRDRAGAPSVRVARLEYTDRRLIGTRIVPDPVGRSQWGYRSRRRKARMTVAKYAELHG